MQRKIAAFSRDEQSDWVAALECGHERHTRHQPPLAERPWVVTEQGRTSRLGTTIECTRCERREVPSGYAPYRRTATFTADSVPKGLLSRHTTARGIWARIHVEAGRLRYRLHEPFFEELILEPGTTGVVLPGVAHEVEPLEGARFFVEFLRPPGAAKPLQRNEGAR